VERSPPTASGKLTTPRGRCERSRRRDLSR